MCPAHDEVAAALHISAKRPLSSPEWELAQQFAARDLRAHSGHRLADGRAVPVVPQVDLVPPGRGPFDVFN